jgi:hypothetical protein
MNARRTVPLAACAALLLGGTLTATAMEPSIGQNFCQVWTYYGASPIVSSSTPSMPYTAFLPIQPIQPMQYVMPQPYFVPQPCVRNADPGWTQELDEFSQE